MPRIALIHATQLSIAPINAELERHWPEAQWVRGLIPDRSHLPAFRSESACGMLRA